MTEEYKGLLYCTKCDRPFLDTDNGFSGSNHQWTCSSCTQRAIDEDGIDFDKFPPVTLTGSGLVKLWERDIVTSAEVRQIIGLPPKP